MHEFFTLQELKELQSSFKYGSYSSCGDPDQPIVRKSILRKIEKAIEIKVGLKSITTFQFSCFYPHCSYYPQNNMTHPHHRVPTAQSRTIENKKSFFAMILFIILFFGASYYAPEHIEGYTTAPAPAPAQAK